MSAAGSSTIHDFVCTCCGLMCDDLALTVAEERVTALSPACPLAERTLIDAARGQRLAACFVDGRPATVEQGLARAAETLQAARAPLVTGLARATVEAQRLAATIADRLGGLIVPTDDSGRSESHETMPSIGGVTATLGEIAERSELLVLWGVDLPTNHPRLLERLGKGKTVVAVDSPDAASASTLRAIIRKQSIEGAPDRLRLLAEQLATARYPAILCSPCVTDSLVHLLRDLHAHADRRAVALELSGGGNLVGAAQVLAWQTGFPAAVSFARGYPEHLPGEADAPAILDRGAADALLVVGADPLPHMPSAAQDHWRRIPTIVLDDRATATAAAATVALGVARFETETAGAVFRTDGVALPLRPAITPPLPPLDFVLQQLFQLLVG